MTESEKVAEWVRWYRASHLKMNALCSVLENDPNLLPKVLDVLGLASALDVISECVNDAKK
jgi:signal transduction histidine kinase